MKDPKQNLIQAACRLLENGCDPEELTTRGIATEAGVAHGLVNYHFGSKGSLLFAAVQEMIRQEALESPQQDFQVSSLRERILIILMMQVQLYLKNPTLLSYAVQEDLKAAGIEMIKTLLPILRESLGGEKREEQLFLMASQLVQPLELFFLHPEVLQKELGWTMENPQKLTAFLETLLSNLGIN